MTGYDPGRKRADPGVPVKTTVSETVLEGIRSAAERRAWTVSNWVRQAILEKLRAEN